jgi:hypothetical protein
MQKELLSQSQVTDYYFIAVLRVALGVIFII